jgi:hypothetical protein
MEKSIPEPSRLLTKDDGSPRACGSNVQSVMADLQSAAPAVTSNPVALCGCGAFQPAEALPANLLVFAQSIFDRSKPLCDSRIARRSVEADARRFSHLFENLFEGHGIFLFKAASSSISA